MAQFQIVDEYGFLGGVGGSCAFCNASKRTTDRPEKIVTTSLLTDMLDAPPGVWPEKYLEVCETCINELGQLVGMITEKQEQALSALYMQVCEENTKLQAERDVLQEELGLAVKALRFVPHVAESVQVAATPTPARKTR